MATFKNDYFWRSKTFWQLLAIAIVIFLMSSCSIQAGKTFCKGEKHQLVWGRQTTQLKPTK